jgi:adenylate cyclase
MTRRPTATLQSVARVVERLSRQFDIDGLVRASLNGLRQDLAMRHVIYLQLDEASGRLTVIGSRGYSALGACAGTVLGGGIIGMAAATGRAIRIDSRHDASRQNNPGFSRSTPALADAQSQIAVPVPVNGRVRGVLFAESPERQAFCSDDEFGMSIIASQMGSMQAALEALQGAEQTETPREWALPGVGARTPVLYYAYDDSIFIDGQYVIKGIAGRLLHYMITQYQVLGRSGFSNKEIRLETMLRLPTMKDNLETRLILLRRRLETRKFPVRLVAAGRGRVTLQVRGELELAAVLDHRK